MTLEDQRRSNQVRARQRSRALLTGLLLAAFALLMYLITIARMSG
jgi:hypothetical protein